MSQDNVILHPAMVKAINAEMAEAGAREVKQDLEIAKLHGVISGMRKYCELAKKDCCHSRSFQAERLRMAIDMADRTIGAEDAEERG